MKRLLDVVAAALGLAALSPLFLVAALAIRLDSSGPVFYRQERVGLRGRRFRIHKFRTMAADAGEGPQLTVGEDQRVTRVGRVLRRYKLDELPQLIDVVRGDMSLVGPRPEVPRYVAHYSPRDREIVLSVRPGITDFASIRYRDESEVLARYPDPEATYVHRILPRKLRYYRFYVGRRSTWLDLRLIAMTLCALAGREPRR